MKDISGNSAQKFEGEWQEAFEGKEMTPAPALWERIDGQLTKQENRQIKKGLYFYKWLAAACVILMLGVTTYFLVGSGKSEALQSDQITTQQDGSHSDPQDKNETAQQNDNPNGIETKDIMQHQGINGTTNDFNESIASQSGNQNKAINNKPGEANNVLEKENSIVASENNQSTSEKYIAPLADYTPNGDLTDRTDSKTLTNASSRPLTVALLSPNGSDVPDPKPPTNDIYIQKVIDFTDDPFHADESKGNRFWAGIDFSSGQYNPNYGGGSSADQALAAENSLAPGRFNSSNFGPSNSYDVSNGVPGALQGISNLNNVQNIQNGTGQTLTAGVNMGAKIAKKWVIHGSLNYLQYNSTGNTNATIQGNGQEFAAIRYYTLAQSNSLSFSNTTISYDNRLDYLSIPVNAGYMILDKKFGIMLSMGVSSDFLLSTRISPQSGTLSDYSVGPGADSPYRSVNFNGVVGTQFRYSFAQNYSLTLEPTYSRSINSLNKENYGVGAYPSAFRLGVGIKYIFR